jgi:cell division septum initiation protein DivIVA
MSLSESASAQVQAILQAAETSAAEIKREAEAEAERIRSAAHETKQADVSGLLAMVASLRKDLDALEAKLKELQGSAAAPVPPPETAKTTRAPKAAPAVAEEAFAPGDQDADAEGARLIALNMALNGEPREATDRYLAENFDLSDRAGLLDEVYASLEG